MPLDRYKQQPTERRRRSIDYTPWLDVDETITDVDVEVTPATVPPFVIDGVTLDVDLKEVTYFASGGVDSSSYTATLRITTSGGQIREDEIEFDVEDT